LPRSRVVWRLTPTIEIDDAKLNAIHPGTDKYLMLTRRHLLFLSIALSLGLLVRLLFSLYLSKYYFGEVKFTFGDSFSYTEAFLNLLNHGTYTFDLENLDAYFFRGPVYPFFWGAHYLLFGESHVYSAVAITQSLLDILSGLLVFLILRRLGAPASWALIGAVLYLFNPLLLVHVPITGTETLAIFLTLLTFYMALQIRQSTVIAVWVGVLCGLALLTRQYLGLLWPIISLYVFFGVRERSLREAIKLTAAVTVGFAIILSPWFLRNFINHDTPTILMGKTAGYLNAQEDYLAFKNFYSLFLVDITPVYTAVAVKGENELPDAFFDFVDVPMVRQADLRAFQCGPSFKVWREQQSQHHPEEYLSCKEEVSENYLGLAQSVLENSPAWFPYIVPMKNVGKAIFKSSLTSELHDWKDNVIKGLFGVRTFIVLSASTFLFLLPWKRHALFLLFPLGLIFYISVFLKQVEMRYLAQADAVMIVFAVLAWHSLIARVGQRSQT
jgi:4-amino-4-deoxy-L-arabinose transferase-like glycosyltransferase